MNRQPLSIPRVPAPPEPVTGETLVSAQALLSALHSDLGSAGLDRLIEVYEWVERAYEEFPELEQEFPREDLAEKLRSATHSLADGAAVPLLMLCVALDPSSASVSGLLEKMSRSPHDQAIVGVVRVLARTRDFTWDEVAPAIEQLRLQRRMDAVLAIISEVLDRLHLAPDRGALEFGNILKRLLIDGDDSGNIDPTFFAGIAWSARKRLRRPTRRRARGNRDEAALSLAERVSAKLFATRLSPPPPVLPPRLAWPSRRLAFAEFAVQWPKRSVEVDWLPMMRVGDAGDRIDGVLRARPGQKGHIVYGPYFRLPPSEYHVRVRMDAGRAWGWSHHPVARVEAVTDQGQSYLARHTIGPQDCSRRQHEFSFVVTEAAASRGHNILELRVWTSGTVPLSLSSITVERLSL